MSEWPRLSETLTQEKHPLKCQSCGVSEKINFWQEHDGSDLPEYIVIALCERCANRIIDPHPRLYRILQPNEPWPGIFPFCIDCKLRDGVKCIHPNAKQNGGPGIPIDVDPPVTAHVCRVQNGKRVGHWMKAWRPARGCPVKVTLAFPEFRGR